jgi:glycosyltransferase involved in cell wall biosynthesis
MALGEEEGRGRKILLISTSVFPSPPSSYGGAEVVVYNLAVGLRDLGYEVSVAAPEGSKLPKGVGWINTGRCGFDNPEHEAYEKYKDVLKDFDVVLDHTWKFYSVKSKMNNSSLKIIKTLHGTRPWGSKPPLEKPCLVGVSKWHSQYIRDIYGVEAEYAYNGIDLEQYPYSEEKEDYLMFLARMSYYKGALQFIDICKKTGMKGVLVGSDQYVEDFNFVWEVMRRCDGKQIQYYGEVPHQLKIHLLQHAKALISPLLPEYHEVFGLNLVESLSCGTPVICTDQGACREIVEDEVSGFVVPFVGAIPKAIEHLDSINPKDCREQAEKFSLQTMAHRYSYLIRKVLNEGEW